MGNHMQPILEFKNVDTGYGAIQALRGVSMEVFPGEIVTLIGANGAGKSTLLGTIFKSPTPWEGEVLYKQQSLTPFASHQIAPLGIALVPEGRRVFPLMSVLENLKMGTVAIGDHYATEDLDTIFNMFPILYERRHQRSRTLSGGEQQMLAIGRALMSRPNLLLLDEPSLGLAPIIVQQIFQVLSQIAAQGTTIFLVEQNANLALSLCHRGYVLQNGSVRLSGLGSELLQNQEIKEAYLG